MPFHQAGGFSSPQARSIELHSFIGAGIKMVWGKSRQSHLCQLPFAKHMNRLSALLAKEHKLSYR
jgi:hypothetical protein